MAKSRRIAVLDMDELARMNEEEEVKGGARNAIILAILVIAVGAYCLAFGLQTLIWIEARQWVSADSWVGNTPRPLTNTSTSTPTEAQQTSSGSTKSRPGKTGAKASGDQPKAFNYEFKLPWGGQWKISPLPIGVQLRYDSGQVVVFYDPELQIDTAHALRTPTTPEAQRLANILAPHPIESNYALYQGAYGASPAEISPMMKEQDALRDNLLMFWKLSFGRDLYSGTTPEFYSFDWGKNRGFQFGDPAKGHPVAVRVFDDSDHQFRFIFTAADGSSGKIKQEDINLAMQSLQPVPIIER
jgi:hypothetical protein